MDKHAVNDPKDATVDSLRGLAYANPHLLLDVANKTVFVKPESKRVALICGGGTGHEPAHAGFVGEGMLSAAVCGSVFASPNSKQFAAAIKRMEGGRGTLLIVKNYTGDALNAGLALEKAKAAAPSADVRMVIVGDDVSVGREAGALVGRRGLAATVLVYKIAGALAAQGESLDNVERVAKHVAEHSGTIGVSFAHCHVPGSEKDDKSKLKDDEAELGCGIHNEPGFESFTLSSAQKLVGYMLEKLTSTSDKDRSFVPFKHDGSDRAILLVNNLGGLNALELGIVMKEAGTWLMGHRITVVRALSGTFMTSLNMPGFSLSLVLLPTEKQTEPEQITIDADMLLELLDAPTSVPGWRNVSKTEPNVDVFQLEAKEDKRKPAADADVEAGPKPTDDKLFVEAIKSACKSVIAAEPEITKYDREMGDGDAGQTLKSGASAVLEQLKSTADIPTDDVAAALRVIADTLEDKMGGTSGALYSIFFSALAGHLQTKGDGGKAKADAKLWAASVEHAFNRLLTYTHARPPSRTLVDPLSAFTTTFSLSDDDFDGAVQAAKDAAENTAALPAKVGRTAYLDKDKVGKSEIPDAGAWGVWRLLAGIQEARRAAQ